MITKEGKARWVYRCGLCGVEETAVDQLRILEAQNMHLRGNITHFANAVAEAFRPLAEQINKTVKAVSDVSEQLHGLRAPAPNLPYDPALRNDKRKWGGR